MEWLVLAAAIGVAYLLGSIPTSVWAGRVTRGIDIRDYGSGNAGATNTYRVLGPRMAVMVFLADVLKGFLAVALLYPMAWLWPEGGFSIYHQFALGLAAMLGHVFPIFAGFRGGKGVATLCGVVLALQPLATLMALAVFTLGLLGLGYVSVGSILAGISFPLLLVFLFPSAPRPMLYFAILLAVLLIVTHRKNIVRLSKGQEHRFTFRRGKD